MTSPPPFQPGFRLSALDAMVLVAGAVGSMLVARVDLSLGIVIGFTVGHFFLFCNVFRMPRPLELIWAAVFVILAGSTLLIHSPPWHLTFVVSVAVTCVVAIQMRRPSYHGVLWSRINPGLPAWWELNGPRAHKDAP